MAIQNGPERWQKSHDRWPTLDDDLADGHVGSMNWLLTTFLQTFENASTSDQRLAILAIKDAVRWLDAHRKTNALLLEVYDLGNFISWWHNENVGFTFR
jgi:hypothetical protein